MTARPRAISPAMLGAYRRTDYAIGGRLHVTIGRRLEAIDDLLAGMGVRTACLVTASNPRSRRMASGWNARMNAALERRLARLPHGRAEGRLGGWRERGFVVGGDPRVLARLARLFRQNAVVVLARGRPPSLRVVALETAPGG